MQLALSVYLLAKFRGGLASLMFGTILVGKSEDDGIVGDESVWRDREPLLLLRLLL